MAGGEGGEGGGVQPCYLFILACIRTFIIAGDSDTASKAYADTFRLLYEAANITGAAIPPAVSLLVL